MIQLLNNIAAVRNTIYSALAVGIFFCSLGLRILIVGVGLDLKESNKDKCPGTHFFIIIVK